VKDAGELVKVLCDRLDTIPSLLEYGNIEYVKSLARDVSAELRAMVEEAEAMFGESR
jgi:hypothetical protein